MTIKHLREIELPNGEIVDNYSKRYMLWCEALSLSKKPLHQRIQFLNKLTDEKRVEGIKYFLTLIWEQRPKKNPQV